MPTKNTSEKEIVSPNVPARGLLLFGPPLLIEGEDAAAYDQLLARIWAAVKPVDIIDEMFMADIVFLEWEVLAPLEIEFDPSARTPSTERFLE